jgi:hypothetical protein
MAKINPPKIESTVPSMDFVFLDNLRGLFIAFI